VEGPHRLAMAKVWEKIDHDAELSDDQEGKMVLWRAAAKENGWSPKTPKKEIKVKSAKEFIGFNYGLLALCWLIALPCLFWCLRTRGNWIESTENGLRNSAGKELTLDQITKVDKARWDKKGITVVHYTNNQGPGTFVIDDLKFERAATDEIMVTLSKTLCR